MTHDVRPPFTYATLIRQVYQLKKEKKIYLLLIKYIFRLLLNLQIIN